MSILRRSTVRSSTILKGSGQRSRMKRLRAIETLNLFGSWIFGNKLFIYSDHNPLSYLTESVPKVLNC